MAAGGEASGQNLEAISNVEIGNKGVQVIGTIGGEGSFLLRAPDPFAILAFPLWRSIHGSQVAIGPDADVVFAANLDGVFEVPDDIDRHGLRIHAQVRPEDYPGYAPFIRQRPQLGVADVTRQI